MQIIINKKVDKSTLLSGKGGYMLKKIFCKHKDNEVICWHWTHGAATNEIRFIEIQLRCKNCDKYHFKNIRDWNECEKFISKNKDKQWGNSQPILNW